MIQYRPLRRAFCLVALCLALGIASPSFAQIAASPRQLKSGAMVKLENAKTGDKRVDKKLERIIWFLQRSLEDRFWLDDWHLAVEVKGKAYKSWKHFDWQMDNEGLQNAEITGLMQDLQKSLSNWDLDERRWPGLGHRGYTKAKRVFQAESIATLLMRIEILKKNRLLKYPKWYRWRRRHQPVISDELETLFKEVIADLLQADALLVETAIKKARIYLNFDRKIDRQIKMAERALERAYQAKDKQKPVMAIRNFKKAWEHAQLALKHVTPEIATQAANNWLSEMEEAFTSENQEQLFKAAAAIIETGEGAIPSLVNVIQDKEKDIEFRSMSIELLSNVGDESAIEPLINILKTEEKGELRDAAALALGIVGDETILNTLIETLKYEKEARVRESVAITLGVMRDERALVPLTRALGDKDKGVRTNAVRALGDLGDKRAVEPLIEVLKDENDYVRFTAAGILGELKDRKAIEPLLGLLQDESEDVRWNTAKTLTRLVEASDENAIPFLIEALEDEHSSARRYAAEALVKIGIPAIDALLVKYEDGRNWVRNEVAFALGEIGDDRAAEALREMLQSENKSDALNAAIALAKLGYEEGYDFTLNTFLTDGDSFVRTDAVRALGEIGDDRAVPFLIEALEDDDLFVREAAAVALNKITGEVYEYQ